MTRRDTIDDMRAIASERGGRCLSVTYINQRSPLKWECSAGHQWEACGGQIKGSRNKPGTWCPDCGRQRSARKRAQTRDDMVKLAATKGGTFASEDYLGAWVKHRWHCREYPAHPEFAMKPGSVTQGSWCPKCAGNAKPTLDELQDLARSHSALGRCVSDLYVDGKTPLEWECGVVGHPSFWLPYVRVKHDSSWCKLCKKAKPNPTKYDTEMLAAFAESIGGALVSQEPFLHTKQKLSWRCADGHEFKRTLNSIIQCKSFCGVCARRAGRREEYVRQLLVHMFGGANFGRARPPWLLNSRGNLMELDGYNRDLGIAFEHNGVQHYEIDGYLVTHAKQLKQREDDDAAKVRLCAAHDVNLIVIPWNIPDSRIQDFITRELAKDSIEPPVLESFGVGVLAPSILHEYSRLAQERGGQLLSNRYSGIEGKLLWKCAVPDHKPFEATPNSVINGGRWCRKCANEKQSDSFQIPLEQVRTWASKAGGELITTSANACGTLALRDTAEFQCSYCNRRLERRVRSVRDGHLCLCQTKKSRIDTEMLEKILSQNAASLVAPETVRGGKTEVALRCERCQTEWKTRAANVVNSGVSCPRCRKNASVTLEKARGLADQIGFALLSTEVRGGMDVLLWQCRQCGTVTEKPYRQMRNTRRCRHCMQRHKLAQLTGVVLEERQA